MEEGNSIFGTRYSGIGEWVMDHGSWMRMKQIGDTRYSIFESATLTTSACGVLRDPLRQAEREEFWIVMRDHIDQ
jgi:hypothetical protein